MNVHEPYMAHDAELRASRRFSRPALIAVAVAAILLVAMAAFFLSRGDADAGTAGAPAAETGAEAAGGVGPAVTVFVPGMTAVQNEVRVNGSLAARRDLPVGVQGSGGMVTGVNVDAGDYVRKGQVLASIDKSVQSQQVAQLRAALEQARADAALAQSELERAQALTERGFISQADIERRTANRDSANARVNVAAAQLRQAQAQLAQLDVRAPEAGLVLARNVEKGQVVGPGSGALFRIAQGGQMELRAEVAEAELQRVKPGQPAIVTLVGSPTEYSGTVWLVEPLIDRQSRLGLARITLAGGRDLRPGAFATGTIQTGEVTGPVVPESAVLGEAGESYVYVVNANDKVERRDVTVGSIGPRGVAVTGGLDGTERVVMSAGAFLNEGEQVQPTLADRG